MLRGRGEHCCLDQATLGLSCQRPVPLPWWPCYSFTPMSDFFFLHLHNLRFGRSLSDDGAQPPTPQWVSPQCPCKWPFREALPPWGPQGPPRLPKSFYSIFPHSWETKHSPYVWAGMTFLSVLIFYSTQLYWSLVSLFQDYSVLLIGQEFLMILEREKGRASCLLLNFLFSWK